MIARHAFRVQEVGGAGDEMSLDWSQIDGPFETAMREALGDLFRDSGIALDRPLLEHFSSEIAAGRLDAEAQRLVVPPEPPGEGEIEDLELLEPAERQRLDTLGRDAMARGEVAAAVLNGGMATRFGGAVKGIVPAIGGRAFLELKRAQALRFGPVPLLVMNSFATHRATLDFLSARGLDRDVYPFLQSVSLRLTPEGDVFREQPGSVSPYAPGHGDFGEALLRCGLLATLRARGVRAIVLSNVDNLGADLNPAIVGFHLDRARAMTVEVARSIPGDVGGAPVRADGRLQLLEGFRFPHGFDFDALPFMNTNTCWFATEALGEEHPLTWFYVRKDVGGRTAIQMERLVGELSAFLETSYLAVPRFGPDLRYFPVKTQEDLEELRNNEDLARRFS